MRPHSSLTAEQRLAAVDLFEKGFGYRAVSSRLGVSVSAICTLESRFKIWGRAALENKPTKQVYFFEFKLAEASGKLVEFLIGILDTAGRTTELHRQRS